MSKRQTTTMSDLTREAEIIIKMINNDWFDGVLPVDECVITVQNRLNTPARFVPHHTYKVHDDRHERLAVEINLNAKNLDEPIETICAYLIGEMSHWVNWTNNIRDTSNNDIYHNMMFKREAEKHGIIVQQAEKVGWGIIKPSEALVDWCIANNLDRFQLCRKEYKSSTNTYGKAKTFFYAAPKKSNSHKLICPSCKITVRYTTQDRPYIICGGCRKTMIDAPSHVRRNY